VRRPPGREERPEPDERYRPPRASVLGELGDDVGNQVEDDRAQQHEPHDERRRDRERSP
jgi:hypothetical protein